jgi:quercetin dioxygenase-like cupin family protein
VKRYRFDTGVGRAIEAYGSTHLVITRITRALENASIVCMHLGPEGEIGYHQAASPQLFLVMAGDGWVSGGDEKPVPIRAGQAAFWESGEWHAAGSPNGMTAIVIEAQALEPETTLKFIEEK